MANETPPVIAPDVDWACSSAIIGLSGSGKSRSMINLPEDKAIILNTEGKKLPFKKKFPSQRILENYQQLLGPAEGPEKDKGLLQSAINSPAHDFIVLDSLTSWAELVLEHANATQEGWDVYKLYNSEIGRLLKVVKQQRKKMIFVLGIPDNVEGLNGLVEKRMKISGNVWKGNIEKEFTIVFFTKTIKGEDHKVNYHFETQTDTITSAKSPEGMFAEHLIPNDMLVAAQGIRDYYI